MQLKLQRNCCDFCLGIFRGPFKFTRGPFNFPKGLSLESPAHPWGPLVAALGLQKSQPGSLLSSLSALYSGDKRILIYHVLRGLCGWCLAMYEGRTMHSQTSLAVFVCHLRQWGCRRSPWRWWEVAELREWRGRRQTGWNPPLCSGCPRQRCWLEASKCSPPKCHDRTPTARWVIKRYGPQKTRIQT